MSNVLITGATGFIGQALLARLIEDQSVNGTPVSSITLCIRPKTGFEILERFKDLLNQKAFLNISAEKRSWALAHIHFVEWDLLDPNFGGMNNTDSVWNTQLKFSIDLVIHVAASVEYFPPIFEAVMTNFYATVNLYKWACCCVKHVQFIHVSTCYIHSYLPSNAIINESLQSPPTNLHPNYIHSLLYKSEMWWNVHGYSMQSKWPNTYTFTKYLAEWFLKESQQKETNCSIVIVRPATVVPAFVKPYAGYTLNTFGLGSFFIALHVDHMSMVLADRNVKPAVVPVDMVVDDILTSTQLQYNVKGIQYVQSVLPQNTSIFEVYNSFVRWHPEKWNNNHLEFITCKEQFSTKLFRKLFFFHVQHTIFEFCETYLCRTNYYQKVQRIYNAIMKRKQQMFLYAPFLLHHWNFHRTLPLPHIYQDCLAHSEKACTLPKLTDIFYHTVFDGYLAFHNDRRRKRTRIEYEL